LKLINTICKVGKYEMNVIIRFKENLEHLPDNVRLHEQITKIKTRKSFIKIPAYIFLHLTFFLYIKYGKLFSFLISKKRISVLNLYKESDLIISSPGGFFEDSNFSYYVNIFQLYLGVLLKKRIIIAPQSIGPIKSNIGKFFLKYILKNVEHIFVRETYSYNFVINELMIEAEKITLTSDMAFLLKDIDFSSEFETDYMYNYSTVVNWSFPMSNNVLESRNNYVRSMQKFYQYIYNKYGRKTVLLNQVASDLPIAYDIASNHEDFIIVDETSYTPNEMIKKIQNSDIFVGTRFHSCIFAMLGNSPFIAISYLPKTDGILNYMDLNDYLISVYDISDTKLIQMYEHIKENKNNIKKEIYKKVLNQQKENLFYLYLLKYIEKK